MPDFWVTKREGIELPYRHDPNLKRMTFEEYLAKYPGGSFGPKHEYVREQGKSRHSPYILIDTCSSPTRLASIS